MPHISFKDLPVTLNMDPAANTPSDNLYEDAKATLADAQTARHTGDHTSVNMTDADSDSLASVVHSRDGPVANTDSYGNMTDYQLPEGKYSVKSTKNTHYDEVHGLTVTLQEVSYTVKVNDKENSTFLKRRKMDKALLDGVSCSFVPGRLVALMGSSGGMCSIYAAETSFGWGHGGPRLRRAAFEASE